MRSEVEAVKQEPQFAAFVSIDWADKKHVWCLQAAGSEQRESGELMHTPEAVEAWVGQLATSPAYITSQAVRLLGESVYLTRLKSNRSISFCFPSLNHCQS